MLTYIDEEKQLLYGKGLEERLYSSTMFQVQFEVAQATSEVTLGTTIGTSEVTSRGVAAKRP